MPGRRAKKEKVPSVFVFVSAKAAVAVSSKKTEASATALPVELRTVPDTVTVIAGRGSAAGVCAGVAVADRIGSKMAAAKERKLLEGGGECNCFARCKRFISGILRSRRPLARVGCVYAPVVTGSMRNGASRDPLPPVFL